MLHSKSPKKEVGDGKLQIGQLFIERIKGDRNMEGDGDGC